MKQTITSTHPHSATQQVTGAVYPSFLAFVLLIMVGLLSAACQPIRPVMARVNETSPANRAIDIVQRYYSALNAAVAEPGQIDEAMRFLAPNAIFINPTGSYLTLAAIRDSLAAGATDGITFDLTNFREQGGRVVYDFKVKIGDELLDVGTDGLTIVQDGLIIFDGTERTEPSFAQYADPVLVVQAYYAALNAAVDDPAKIDLAMAYLAPDALFINSTGSYRTFDAIRASLAAGAADGITFELSNFRNTNGRVVYDYKVRIGNDLLDEGADGLTILKDGKIIFDGTERTEPS